MTSLWTRVEPLEQSAQARSLHRCEHGRHSRARTGEGGLARAHPDAYQNGALDQGLQILDDHPNERDDSIVERAYAPNHQRNEARRSRRELISLPAVAVLAEQVSA
ncbi:hypothetical protein BH20ACT4_BH20ACT4_08180 [soil metagenome]